MDEGICSSTHGNVAWHQMRLPLMHAVTGEISSSAAYADDNENPSAASVSPDTDTLEFPVVEA